MQENSSHDFVSLLLLLFVHLLIVELHVSEVNLLLDLLHQSLLLALLVCLHSLIHFSILNFFESSLETTSLFFLLFVLVIVWLIPSGIGRHNRSSFLVMISYWGFIALVCNLAVVLKSIKVQDLSSLHVHHVPLNYWIHFLPLLQLGLIHLNFPLGNVRSLGSWNHTRLILLNLKNAFIVLKRLVHCNSRSLLRVLNFVLEFWGDVWSAIFFLDRLDRVGWNQRMHLWGILGFLSIVPRWTLMELNVLVRLHLVRVKHIMWSSFRVRHPTLWAALLLYL